MARRTIDTSVAARLPLVGMEGMGTAPSTEAPDTGVVAEADKAPGAAAETPSEGAASEVPEGDAASSAPTIVVAEEASQPPVLDEVPPTEPAPVERFRVETGVYYVPTLGFGAVFVPAGTIITRVSHDLQKLIAQGATLRPVD